MHSCKTEPRWMSHVSNIRHSKNLEAEYQVEHLVQITQLSFIAEGAKWLFTIEA